MTPATAKIAETPAQHMWPRPLVCEYIDGDVWRLRFAFKFISPSPLFPSITVPAGTETDFASIPRFFWRVIHPTHKHIGKIAVVHDYYYRTASCPVSRVDADNALRAGMEALGAPKWKSEACFYVVRTFGPLVVPAAYVPRST